VEENHRYDREWEIMLEMLSAMLFIYIMLSAIIAVINVSNVVARCK